MEIEVTVYDKSWERQAVQTTKYPESVTLADIVRDAKALALWVEGNVADEEHPPAKINIRPKGKDNTIFPQGVTEIAIRLT